jgi:hypothetical protein
MGKFTGAAALAVAILAAAPTAAQANPNMSRDSTCGLHAGKVLRRDSGGTVYRFRIGPRMYHSGGDMICKGHVRKASASKTTDGCCSINWQPFSLPNWRDFFNGRTTHADIVGGFTAAGCQSFGESLAAVIISEGVATPALVIGGASCAYGVYSLGPKIPSGTDNLKHMRITK